MNRRERRRRERERKKLEDKIRKEASQPQKEHEAVETPQSRARRYFAGTILGTRLVMNLFFAGLTLAAGYALFSPHVSVEPGLVLNPGDPYSTQFTVTNDNAIFNVKDLHPACRTHFVQTSHNVRLEGLPPFPSPPIPIIAPREQTTMSCGRWIGGLGAGAGNVLVAYSEIDVSYKQDWWPFPKTQRFPLKGAIDSQGGVHWTHRTPTDFK